MKQTFWLVMLIGLVLLLTGCPEDPEIPVVAEPGAGDTSFALDGLGLGAEAAILNARYTPPQLQGMAVWVEPSVRGYVTPEVADAANYPVEMLVFDGGSLAGFSRALYATLEEFEVFQLETSGTLGAASMTPPAWAQGSGFFAGLPVAGGDAAYYWGDQEQGYVMAAFYDSARGLAHYVIADPELYSAVLAEAAELETTVVTDAADVRDGNAVAE